MKKKKAVTKHKPKQTMIRKAGSNAIVPINELSLPEALEKVLIQGDLTPLSPQERVDYYNRLCRTLHLNPLTRPFDYIAFRESNSGDEDEKKDQPGAKLSIYANKSCTEQLRKIHGVSIVGRLRREIITRNDEPICLVEADARDRTGKTDTATGAVMLYKMRKTNSGWTRVNLTGREYCNAIMKCETKAKRRATLSICGLGFMDVSELDTVQVVGGATADGKVYYHDELADPERALLEQEAESRQHPDEAKLRAAGLWCEKHRNDSRQCPTDEHTQRELDAQWEAEKKAKEGGGKPARAPDRAPASAPTATKTSKGTIEIDLTDPADPILRGDIGNLTKDIEKHCTATWKDDWWHILPKDVPTMHAMAKHYGYDVREIAPKAKPAQKSSGKKEDKPENKRKPSEQETAPSGRVGSLSNARTFFTGNIVRCVMGTTQRQQPVLNVRIGNEWHPCYVNTIFEHLTNRDGYVIECWLDKSKSICGLKRVGKVYFEEDGKTPVPLSVDREPGTASLFGS